MVHDYTAVSKITISLNVALCIEAGFCQIQSNMNTKQPVQATTHKLQYGMKSTMHISS